MGKIDDMMKPTNIEEETWDSELPAQLGFTLTEGKHEIKITNIELVNTRFADEKTGQVKKALQITGNTSKHDIRGELARVRYPFRGKRLVPEIYLEAKKKQPSKQAHATYGITYAKASPQ